MRSRPYCVAIDLHISFPPLDPTEILSSASPTNAAQPLPRAKDSAPQHGCHGQSPDGYKTCWRHFPEAAPLRISPALQTNAPAVPIGQPLESPLPLRTVAREVR